MERDINMEQLQQILNMEDNQDETCISLFDVANLIYDIRCAYEKNLTDEEKELRKTFISSNPFYSLKYVKSEIKHDIKDVNSNFLIDIASLDYISINTKNISLAVNIMLKHNPERVEKNYSWVCASSLTNFLKENEERLLQKIYVKINDCPLFIQSFLFNMRAKQLIQSKWLLIQKNNEEIIAQKKNRTLSFTRRNND